MTDDVGQRPPESTQPMALVKRDSSYETGQFLPTRTIKEDGNQINDSGGTRNDVIESTESVMSVENLTTFEKENEENDDEDDDYEDEDEDYDPDDYVDTDDDTDPTTSKPNCLGGARA